MVSYILGKFVEERSDLDYLYHSYYTPERVFLQDRIISKFLHTVVTDSTTNSTCGVPAENWIVFTAGVMGAGKGFVMKWLNKSVRKIIVC